MLNKLDNYGKNVQKKYQGPSFDLNNQGKTLPIATVLLRHPQKGYWMEKKDFRRLEGILGPNWEWEQQWQLELKKRGQREM